MTVSERRPIRSTSVDTDDIADLSVKSTERGIVIGQTGSGKTFFMRWLLLDIQRLVVLDPKGTLANEDASGGDWRLEPWTRRNVKALRKGQPVRMRVPTPEDYNWNPYLEQVYKAGNCVLYNDEIYGVVRPRRPIPYWLNAIYTRGRELGIGAWTASQRPAFIPLEIISEAQWFVLFNVLLDEDRKRMAAFMGPEVMARPEDDFGFWIYHTSWKDGPRYYAGLEVG